jgi:nucleoside phosphorylase
MDAHGAYKTAIICPMAVEMAPVLAMLDQEHSRYQSKRNAYVLGQMGHHNVIITVMSETGNNSAAAMASQLQNDFPSLQFALLVGVGGGVPNMDKHDIRLGDVVVSKPTQTFGGVVQFDHGKLNTNNQFERTGLLNKPPPIVMSNLELLIAEHKRNENRLNDHLIKMLRKFPKMENEQYIHQGEENDVLFESLYPHNSGSDCRNCLPERIVKRQPRYSTAPRIHYGTIGSSNVVVKDARLRDNLRDELGIICVEMEAAGLVDEFPCLVVRGICDYADSHKLKKWQPYAAATAAAFAKEFLSSFPGQYGQPAAL